MKPFNTMYIWKSIVNVTEMSVGIVNYSSQGNEEIIRK